MTETSNTGRKTLTAKILNRITTIWLELVTGFLWWGVGTIPFHSIRKFYYRLFGMKIGKGSNIHMMARIYDPRYISIGADTIVGEKVTMDGRKQLLNSNGGLEIGNHVDIASEVMFWTSQHDLNDPTFAASKKRLLSKTMSSLDLDQLFCLELLSGMVQLLRLAVSSLSQLRHTLL